MTSPRFRHVAIEGPIAAGKSTLARLLSARLDARLLLERPEDNPFLEKYYADSSRYALQTQLTFLFQRVEQYREVLQPGMFGAPGVVSDFMFEKDELFARLTLSDEEYRLYAQIHAEVAPRVPPPDLVVWLQAGSPALLKRIAQRGLAMEQGIETGYLDGLCAAYATMFERNPTLPVLAVDTERFNPLREPSQVQRLIAAIDTFSGPRESLRLD